MGLRRAYLGFYPLVVDVPVGGRRIVAGLLVRKGDVVFADVFWRGASFHPFHVLEGKRKIVGEPPWTVDTPRGLARFDYLVGKSDEEVMEIIFSTTDPDERRLQGQHTDWAKFREADGGRSDREATEAAMRDWIAGR